MDGLFKLLWPMSHLTGPTADIPTYQQGEAEDKVDLQIKSLLYMFRRCNIASSEQFRTDDDLNVTTDRSHRGFQEKRSMADLRVLTETNKNALNKYSSDGLHGMSAMDKQKLDVMYSKYQFERVLSKDEHRVLIDWTKNKFRSLCILSGPPKEMDTLPSFESPNYHFIILPASSSDEDYIRILSCSDLYIEHSFSLAQRQKVIKEILFSLRARKGVNSNDKTEELYTFTKDDRSFIIHKYLTMLAVEVQVERLYRAALRAKQQQQQQQHKQKNQSDQDTYDEKSYSRSPGRMSRPLSPERNRNQSPERLSNGNRQYSRSPEKVSNGGTANKIFIHGHNPATSPSHKATPKLSSYPSLPSLNSSITTRTQSQNASRSPSPARSPSPGRTSATADMTPMSPSAPKLRTKASTPSLRKMTPDLTPLALTKLGDSISLALQRETMEQARFAVRARIEREKSLLMAV